VAVNGQNTTVDERRGILGRGQWLLVAKADGSSGSATDKDDYSKARFQADFFTNTPSTSNPHRRVDDYNYLTIWPVTDRAGATIYTSYPSLRRVASSCTSEFFVEYLSYVISGGTGAYKWTRNDRDVKPGAVVMCPRAIRVTVAIHDPDDRKPLPQGTDRFRGYALQEVFWISDP
jgi:hypothetical protein